MVDREAIDIEHAGNINWRTVRIRVVVEECPLRHVEGNAVKVRQNHVKVCMRRVVDGDGDTEVCSGLIPIAIGDDIVERLVRIVRKVIRCLVMPVSCIEGSPTCKMEGQVPAPRGGNIKRATGRKWIAIYGDRIGAGVVS